MAPRSSCARRTWTPRTRAPTTSRPSGCATRAPTCRTSTTTRRTRRRTSRRPGRKSGAKRAARSPTSSLAWAPAARFRERGATSTARRRRPSASLRSWARTLWAPSTRTTTSTASSPRTSTSTSSTASARTSCPAPSGGTRWTRSSRSPTRTPTSCRPEIGNGALPPPPGEEGQAQAYGRGRGHCGLRLHALPQAPRVPQGHPPVPHRRHRRGLHAQHRLVGRGGPGRPGLRRGRLPHAGPRSGTGRYLHRQAKKAKRKLTVVGADTVGSVYTHYHKHREFPKDIHQYLIDGIGEDFMPSTVWWDEVDQVVQVSDEDAYLMQA